MIVDWFRKDQTQSQAETLFAALNDQARRPAFYAAGGAPDTVEGRFEVLAAHLFLVIRRLKRDAPASDRLSAALQSIFFRRLDDALREMGVGDLSVGRKIRGFAESFYGRATAYDAALGDQDDALAEALARNVYESDDPQRARLLAAYMRRADVRLAATPPADLAAAVGRLGEVADEP